MPMEHRVLTCYYNGGKPSFVLLDNDKLVGKWRAPVVRNGQNLYEILYHYGKQGYEVVSSNYTGLAITTSFIVIIGREIPEKSTTC